MCFLYFPYVHYSFLIANEWFLASRFSTFPEIIFFNLCNWMRFFFSISLCLAAKLLAYSTLSGIWAYRIFLAVVIDPDKIYGLQNCSYQELNRYKILRYTPAQAYSKKIAILSCYQLHKYIKNCFSSPFYWLSAQMVRHKQIVSNYLFQFQSWFYPTIPKTSFLADVFCFFLWKFLFFAFIFLDFVEQFIKICYGIALSLSARHFLSATNSNG